MYAACKATVKVGDGNEISLHEQTNYPFEETIRFTVNTPKAVSFPFYLRIPSWTEGATIFVNGKKVAANPEAGQYACINREWKDNDQVGDSTADATFDAYMASEQKQCKRRLRSVDNVTEN